ncbi:hypothetical protein P171DRAFT_83200 [Karstenula rhodostoma CBS 690.94]|uniref:Uncharacterized protein n=1 Tax=Karstenula rhodostoma CBS 690.94 TaxID=1392251 RepID=A0A9P4U860_9PLEO|nr:hypothetical protein P171DRAFT_83200 [Karstenula rhodostoma CBS 690.94]
MERESVNPRSASRPSATRFPSHPIPSRRPLYLGYQQIVKKHSNADNNTARNGRWRRQDPPQPVRHASEDRLSFEQGAAIVLPAPAQPSPASPPGQQTKACPRSTARVALGHGRYHVLAHLSLRAERRTGGSGRWMAGFFEVLAPSLLGLGVGVQRVMWACWRERNRGGWAVGSIGPGGREGGSVVGVGARAARRTRRLSLLFAAEESFWSDSEPARLLATPCHVMSCRALSWLPACLRRAHTPPQPQPPVFARRPCHAKPGVHAMRCGRGARPCEELLSSLDLLRKWLPRTMQRRPCRVYAM